MRLVERIQDEAAIARMQNAVREGCSVCERRRHYFDDFYVPGIAERVFGILPVFGVANEKLKKLTNRNRIMTGNRYTGYMVRQEPATS